MTANDKTLIQQMIKAGRFNAVYDLMQNYNQQKAKDIIQEMGEKWCCNPKNWVKRSEPR